MPRPVDDANSITDTEVAEIDDPGERIKQRNSEIDRRLDQTLEALERILEGPKSEGLSEPEEFAAKRIMDGSGRDEPTFREQVMRNSGAIPDMETNNYRDYWKLANSHLRTGESSRCIYLMAGEDWMPALEIEGDWTFLGLGYERDSTVVNGEEIELVNHDISDELPFKGEFDLSVVKSPGAGNIDGELGELGVDRAYEVLDSEGILLTDQDYEGQFNSHETVEPSPIAYLRKVSTEHGSAYNTDQLRVLSK